MPLHKKALQLEKNSSEDASFSDFLSIFGWPNMDFIL